MTDLKTNLLRRADQAAREGNAKAWLIRHMLAGEAGSIRYGEAIRHR